MTSARPLVFDATSLRPERMTGLERFSSNLLHSIATLHGGPLAVLCRRAMCARVRELAPDADVAAVADGSRIVRDQLQAPWALRRRPGPILVPAFVPSPLVTRRTYLYVHDLVPWRFPRTVSRGTRYYYGPLHRVAIPRARALITTSRQVREEILERGWRRPDEVLAAGAGVDPALLERIERAAPPVGAAPGGPRLLTVGTIEPRKNLGVLRAAARAAEADRRWPVGTEIRVVGRQAWGDQRDVEGLRWLGPLDDDGLAREYAASTLFVFPTIYEGYGLPLLEAMAAGVPAVVSDIPVLRELGGDVPVYVPPRDPGAWVDAIADLLHDGDRRRMMIEAGRRKVEEFSYDQTAECILRYMDEREGG